MASHAFSNTSRRVLAFVLAGLLAPGATVHAEERKASVGLSMALTGTWASWGVPLRNGLVMGLEDSAMPLLLDVQDDACEPKQSLTNFTRFLGIEKQKVALLGCLESVEAVAPLLDRHRAILLTLGGMSNEVLKKYPRVVGLYCAADAEVRYLIPYLEARYRSLVAVTHTGLFGEVFGNSLETITRDSKIKLLARERVPVEETDFHSLILRILARKPEVVLIHTSATSLGLFIKQLRGMGYRGNIFTTFTFESDEAKTAGGAALEDTFYTYPSFDSANDGRYLAFAAKYRKRFAEEPNNNAAAAYDLGILLGGAAKKCGIENADCVLQAFTQVGRYSGVGGTLILGKDRLPMRPHGLKQFKDGKYQWHVRELTPVEMNF